MSSLFMTTILLYAFIRQTHGIMLEETDVMRLRCNDTSECLIGRTWCESGFACIAGFCQTIRNYPCNTQTQTCDSSQMTCSDKTCHLNRDCNNRLYCDGTETCVDRRCQISNPPPCLAGGGLCVEASHMCIYPSIYHNWRSLVLKNSRHKEQSVVVEAEHWTPSSNHSHYDDYYDPWVAWVVISIAVVIFFVLVFLMVAMANRGYGYIPIPQSGSSYIF